MTEQVCRLREEELSFFAKIGADVSHELRNVLSIVRENAGLLDDQLNLARGRKVPDLDKLKQVAARITRQVNKGVEVMERFSRFAHAADEPRASIDLVALVEDVTVLMRRHVRHLGGGVETVVPDQSITMATSPFSLQYMLFCCLQIVWECADRSEPVHVALADLGKTATLTVSGAAGPAGNELSHRQSDLSAIAEELGASLETGSADGAVSLILTLPVVSVQRS